MRGGPGWLLVQVLVRLMWLVLGVASLLATRVSGGSCSMWLPATRCRSGLQFFLVLMLYVWLGVGLVSAGFCCQQLLLVARGQTSCQLQKGQLLESRRTWRSNLCWRRLSDVFGSRWALGLFLPVQTVETIPGNWQVYYDHKYD